MVEVGGERARGRPLFQTERAGPMLLQPGGTVPVGKSLNRGRIPPTEDQRDDLLHPRRALMEQKGFMSDSTYLGIDTDFNGIYKKRVKPFKSNLSPEQK